MKSNYDAKNILNYIFFSFFLIKTVFTNDMTDIWYFYKVSKKTVLG